MLEVLVRSMLYYPVTIRRDTPPPSYVVGAQEVWIESRDGNQIHALHWPASTGRPTLLFFHGNAQSVFEWALIREELAPLDCGLLLMDYPGYGKSTGKPSEKALYAGGQACYDWLVNHDVPAASIVVFGKSLGGGVSAKLVSENPVKGMILESTFTSVPAVAKKLFPVLPIGAMFRSEIYDTASRMGNINVPVLVIHGRQDEMIPVSQGQALFEAANEPRELYLVEGAGHSDVSLSAGSAYGRTLRDWLDKIG